ncbi:MAG TPA: sugar phosphate isomerase/epimerase [Candidatus Dormibacteraeota bacterium]
MRTHVEQAPGPRIAFSTLACPAWSLERAVEAAVEHGYQGLELRLIDGETIPPDLGAGQRRRVRDLLAGAGLAIVTVDTSIRLAGAHPASAAADLRGYLELAAEWESPFIRVFGGERPAGAGAAEVTSGMARLLTTVAPDAERLGVGIALETHDSLSRAADVAALLALVESRAVGALWDVLHTYRMGEEPELATSLVGDRLLHVHVKDGRRRPGEAAWDLVPLSQGEVPVGRSLRALREVGYRGWLSVEWEKKWHPEIAEPEVALPQHAAELARLLAGASAG